MAKTLIAVYSRRGENYYGGEIIKKEKGNSEIVAENLHELLPEADFFRIAPVTDYSENYQKATEEVQRDISAGVRPELTEYLPSLDEYDTIYLIYPIFWGTLPPAVRTFIERYDFNGKTVKPIATHEGSAMGETEANLSEALNAATILPGTAILGSDVENSRGTLEAMLA